MNAEVYQWRLIGGWVAGARSVASPNCDARPAGACPELLVIHNISLPPGQFGGAEVEALFTNALDVDAHPFFSALRGLRVSAHFLIRRDGQLLQFVATQNRAWHAGRSTWRGRERCNDFSIGIELEGTDTTAYTDAQYSALAAITKLLMTTYPTLTTDTLAGHSDIAPGRKTDPGPAFDWQRFRGSLADCST